MEMWSTGLKLIDWFVPESAKSELSELNLARNFVFTHLAGPTLSQLISVFLYQSDPDPGFACWTMIVCIWLFLTLPFVFKWSGNLWRTALISVELLAFTSLFGAYYYGGVSSPFLPWFIVSLLLGFFYLSDRPMLVVGLFIGNILVFSAAYALNDFPQRVPMEQLTTVGWVSILSATIYMSWMAIYYANMLSQRSELERESERHRETTARLRQAKEMADTANRSKSIFLAKMSHELRTPLNAVIGFSEILLENVELSEGAEHKKSDLKRINAAGKHLLSLVTDVLDLSKIESNSIEAKVETFDLNEVVHEIVNTVRPLISKNRNRLVVNSATKLGLVSTDPSWVRQAVMNLISNSAKFTEGGVITLDVRRDSNDVGDWVELRVRDTGIGIAQSEIGRLFKNYGQATRGTSSKYGGTGLGLALSQRLCNLMGGDISVASELGKGSCFTIRIPAQMPEDFATARPDAPQGAQFAPVLAS